MSAEQINKRPMAKKPIMTSEEKPADRRSGSERPRAEVSEDKGKGSVSNW